MLLLALPLVAVADPVTVTTRSTGTQITNESSLGTTNSMLNVLGLNPLTSTAPLPYELTLTSTFDTDAMPSPESFWAQAYADVVIDFRIGTQAYHYAELPLWFRSGHARNTRQLGPVQPAGAARCR
jgi:hypothetical protein